MSVFDRIRVRHLVWWWLGTLVLGVVLYGIHAAAVGLAFLLEGTLAAWLLWLERRYGLDTSRLLGPMPGPGAWRVLLVGAGLPILSLAAFVGVYGGLSFVAPGYVRAVLGAIPRESAMFDLGRSFPVLRAILLGTVILVVAPPLEELTFRGVLLHRWARRWGVLPAVLLSSLGFSLLHANKPGAFLLGLTLCAIYLRTGSLWLTIGIHAVNNAAAVLAGAIPALPGSPAHGPDLAQLRRGFPWAALVLLVLLPPLVLYIRSAVRSGVRLPYAANAPEEDGEEVAA